MSKDPWVRFFFSDWLAGTGSLTAAEKGVYITVIALIYETGGPVALDQVRLARRCGLPKAGFDRALKALKAEGKLVQTAEGLMNERCARELSERANRSQNARSVSLQRWRAQSEKTFKNQTEGDATAMRGRCYPQPQSQSESEESSLRSDSEREDGEFSMIWSAAGIGRQPSHGDRREVERWKAEGATAEGAARAVSAVVAKRGKGKPVRALSYFREEVVRAARTRDAAIHRFRRTAAEPIKGTATALEVLESLAAMINGTGFLPESFITPNRARELVAEGLVTEAKMRERGFL